MSAVQHADQQPHDKPTDLAEVMSDQPDSWQRFPPQALREYAFLGDGYRGALVGPRGDVVWLCAPRWDDDAVLCSLIGGEGVFAITPVQGSTWGGWYEPATLVWHSRWITPTAEIECREALAQPADPHRVVLLRRIDARHGTAWLDVVLRPAPGFGREAVRDVVKDDRGTWTATAGRLTLRLSGLADASWDGQCWRQRLRVEPGQHHDVVLELSERPLPAPPVPDEAWPATAHWWGGAVPDLARSAAPRDARHAYAVLLGLTTPGGGTVAAATLGLPERADAGRDYDYRYVWVRDQAYVGISCAVGQPLPLLDVAVQRVSALLLEHGDQLSPAYRIDGGPVPSESSLGLPGYPGGADVLGNHAKDQFQLDVFGEALQLLCAAALHQRLDDDGVRAIHVAAQAIERCWQRPDAGIWEIEDDWWTHSRLSCVAGLRAAARTVGGATSTRWDALADAVLEETTRRCLHPDGWWRRSPRHDSTDAALLLPPVRGALPGDDPRTRATLRRVVQHLSEDGYVYRFDPGGHPLGREEGAFTLCGFTTALATAYDGDAATALRWFERTRAVCGPPGLLAEEFDVRQRQLRGNIPQAFTHALLLESAQRLTPYGPLSPAPAVD